MTDKWPILPPSRPSATLKPLPRPMYEMEMEACGVRVVRTRILNVSVSSAGTCMVAIEETHNKGLSDGKGSKPISGVMFNSVAEVEQFITDRKIAVPAKLQCFLKKWSKDD